MSTYLQLCVKARRDCRLPGTGPDAVTGQTGVFGRLVDWVSDAYIQIQERHDEWRWMRRTATVSTTADDDDYAYGEWTDQTDSVVISRFSRWRLNDPWDQPKCYLSSSGVSAQYWLTYLDWDSFKTIYKIGSQSSGQPAHIAINPNDEIVLGPAPDDTYVVTADYYLGPQTLAADSDTPDMPSRYHNLIVYEAMKRYGTTEGAANIFIEGNQQANRMMRALERSQLPGFRLAEAMA